MWQGLWLDLARGLLVVGLQWGLTLQQEVGGLGLRAGSLAWRLGLVGLRVLGQGLEGRGCGLVRL